MLDQPVLLPVGVFRAAQRQHDMIGLVFLDRVSDHLEDASSQRPAAWGGTDGAEVAEHGVEPLVSHMPEAVDVIGKPGKSPGKGRREDVHVRGLLDEPADVSRQLVRVDHGRAGDEQQPLDLGLRGCRPFVSRASHAAAPLLAPALSWSTARFEACTITTGHGAWWAHCSPTEPSSRPTNPPCPRDPTTRRSPSLAARTRTSAGAPSMASHSKSMSTPAEARWAAASSSRPSAAWCRSLMPVRASTSTEPPQPYPGTSG